MRKIEKTNFMKLYTPKRIILLLIVLFNLFQLPFGNNVLGGFYNLIFLTSVPGGLLLGIFSKKVSINKGKYIVNIVGLSIFYLMIIGLIVNFLGPHTLVFRPLFLSIDFSIIILYILWFRLRHQDKLVKNINFNGYGLINIVLPLILPLLAVMGSIILNNGGRNLIAIACILLLTLILLFIGKFHSSKSDSYMAWLLFCSSLALLFQTSLRGTHLVGWDINLEYKVFQQTKATGHWSLITSYRDYSSCLSITILPTILQLFSHIKDEYIYKFIYPIIFSFAPVALYYLYRNFTIRIISFMSVLFVIAQQAYFSELPSIARQEIGLLFFALMLLTIFSNELKGKTKKLILLIYILSMILSHYSTSYVAIAILTLSYLVIKCSMLWTDKLKKIDNLTVISGRLILISLLFGIFWYSQITSISGKAVSTFSDIANNISATFTGNLVNNTVESAVFGKNSNDSNAQAGLNRYSNSLGSISTSDRYSPSILPSTSIQPASSLFANIVVDLYKLIKYLLVACLILGSIIWLFKRESDFTYSIMAVISLIVMAALVILPVASNDYNFERLFQQIIFITSVCGVTALINFLQFIRFQSKDFSYSMIIIVFFLLYQTGILVKLTGGTPPLSLYNFGNEYDGQYTSQTEVVAIEWLNNQLKNKKSFSINADAYNKLKLVAYGNNIYDSNVNDLVLPQVISKNAYVYAGYTNINDQKGAIDARDKFANGIYWYSFPSQFLKINKNSIYSNGQSIIYK